MRLRWYYRTMKVKLPRNLKGPIDLGDMYVPGEYKVCLKEAQRRLKQDGTDEVAECYRGACLSKLGKHEEALDVLTSCIARNAEWSFLWVVRGDALCELDRHDDAVSDYWQGLQRDPENASLMTRLGQAFCIAGHYELGEEHLRKAVAARESPEPVLALIFVMIQRGRDADAQTLYTEGIEVFPTYREKFDIWMKKAREIAFESVD